MTKKSILNIFTLIIRLFIGSYFIYVAVGKIIHPEAFWVSITNYQLLSKQAAGLVAIYLPWIELFSGLFLILGLNLRGSSIIVCGLLIIFIVAVGSALARGLDINCGCITQKAQPVGFKKIIEELFMLSGILFIFFSEKPSRSWFTIKLLSSHIK